MVNKMEIKREVIKIDDKVFERTLKERAIKGEDIFRLDNLINNKVQCYSNDGNNTSLLPIIENKNEKDIIESLVNEKEQTSEATINNTNIRLYLRQRDDGRWAVISKDPTTIYNPTFSKGRFDNYNEARKYYEELKEKYNFRKQPECYAEYKANQNELRRKIRSENKKAC